MRAKVIAARNESCTCAAKIALNASTAEVMPFMPAGSDRRSDNDEVIVHDEEAVFAIACFHECDFGG